MGKFDGVLLVSDFDDTFITNDLVIPPQNLRALEYFTREGGVFTFATGRSRITFAPYGDLPIINAPVVLSNGSALYDFARGVMIHETFLPDRVHRDLAELIAAIPEIGFEAYHGDEVYTFQPNEATLHHLTRAGTPAEECTSITDIPLPWGKALLQQSHVFLLRAQEYILSHWGEEYEAIFSNARLLELTRKGSHKGGMVAYLARLLGVAREHIYCVGDNQNDLPMLAISAIPFAPGDCAEPVRTSGARLLCPCEAGSIAQLVDILDARY